MLQVKNVKITHRKDLRVIIDSFSMVLNHGDKAVIIGEEGNGKSTLLKWIYSPELVDDYVEAEGERIINNERLGYLPQELPEEDKSKTVYEFFTESPAFWEKNPKELGKTAGEFNVDAEFYYREQTMDSLSGGEKVKAQLMKMLMLDPTVLILDEPSNDLDIETLEWLEQFINDWKYAVLFVSHDEILVENTANMVIHLEQIHKKTLSRHTVFHMPYREYLAHRESVFANQESLATSQRKEQKIKEEKLRKIMQKVEHDQASVSRQDPSTGRLLKKKMHTVKAMEKRFDRESAEITDFPESEEAIFFKLGDKESVIPSGKTVLELDIPELKSPDGKRVLSRNISMNLRGSRKLCIIGKNGAGKTTLLKMIAEKMLNRGDIRAEYMPQDYEDMLESDKTPVEYLSRTWDKEEQTRIRTYLGALKYTADEMDHPIRELSGGQRAKTLLLKMSMSGANVLILDEPTRNFSPLSGPVIRKMLARFPGAIISVSHDRRFIDEVCDTVYEFTEDGLKEMHKD
ncbi:MAG: ABC-F family ATP-binding cassette domain-containing protein [Lachnospiraceae bacterium]|nr:ABC-F family ATP-binding cassette domain-containing protein [Lachnospiraceae bacterium]